MTKKFFLKTVILIIAVLQNILLFGIDNNINFNLIYPEKSYILRRDDSLTLQWKSSGISNKSEVEIGIVSEYFKNIKYILIAKTINNGKAQVTIPENTELIGDYHFYIIDKKSGLEARDSKRFSIDYSISDIVTPLFEFFESAEPEAFPVNQFTLTTDKESEMITRTYKTGNIMKVEYSYFSLIIDNETKINNSVYTVYNEYAKAMKRDYMTLRLPDGNLGGDENGFVSVPKNNGTIDTYFGVETRAIGMCNMLVANFLRDVFYLPVRDGSGEIFVQLNAGISSDSILFDNYKIKMVYFKNGKGLIPPVNGSAISQAGTIGHVSIVKKVIPINDNEIDVVLFEENVYNEKTNRGAHSRRLRFIKKNGYWACDAVKGLDWIVPMLK